MANSKSFFLLFIKFLSFFLKSIVIFVLLKHLKIGDIGKLAKLHELTFNWFDAKLKYFLILENEIFSTKNILLFGTFLSFKNFWSKCAPYKKINGCLETKTFPLYGQLDINVKCSVMASFLCCDKYEGEEDNIDHSYVTSCYFYLRINITTMLSCFHNLPAMFQSLFPFHSIREGLIHRLL